MRKKKISTHPITPAELALRAIYSLLNVALIIVAVVIVLIAIGAAAAFISSAWSMDDMTDSAPWAGTGAVLLLSAVATGILFALFAEAISNVKNAGIDSALAEADRARRGQVAAEEKARKAAELEAIAEATANGARLALKASPDEKDAQIAELLEYQQEQEQEAARHRELDRIRNSRRF